MSSEQPIPPKPETVVVIGNGVIGLACACALRQRGIPTVLIGQEHEPHGPSWGNAGHIAIEQIALPTAGEALRRAARSLVQDEPLAFPWRAIGAWAPFGARLILASPGSRPASRAALRGAMATAVPAWRRLLAAAGAAHLLRDDGHIVLWETSLGAKRGLAHWHATDIGSTRFRDATPAELAPLAAMMPGRIAHAIRFEGTGQVTDPGDLLTALRRHFAAIGGIERLGCVARIEGTDRTGRAWLDDGRVIDAAAIVVAAGVESHDLLKPLGEHIPIIAERGYHIQSPAPAWPRSLPPVVFEDRSLIVTGFRSGVRAAGFAEFDRFASPPNPRRWATLADHVGALRLPFSDPMSRWMGARPTLPDYLPAIGRCRRFPAIGYAFGHQHLGLTLAATTGEAVGAMLCGEAAPFNLAPFSLDRFRRMRQQGPPRVNDFT